MGRIANWLAVVSALCAALPAAAQTAPAPAAEPADRDIVVTGRPKPLTRSEVFEQAQALSRASRRYNEALARFVTPLCPGVSGFTADTAGMIVDRIRANAARLRVPLAGAKCSPNLIVAVVEDGRTLLSNLERTRPQMFSLVAASERTELLGEGEPVRVWNNIVTIGHDGAPVPRWNGEELLPSVWGQTNRWFVPFHRDILSTLVVFDRTAVLGMTLVQLADYATMRGLAHMRPASGTEPMPTILALFEPSGRDTPELTSFDIGYLRSLYWEQPNEPAVSKLLRVRREAAKAQEQAAEPVPVAARDAPAPAGPE
jgi:hypothetical protein